MLTFYDRFAQRNETNPRLHGDAARAYFKVGALNDRMGRDDEAKQAYVRAVELFKGLVAEYPDVPGYRTELDEVIRRLGEVGGAGEMDRPPDEDRPPPRPSLGPRCRDHGPTRTSGGER
jgi:hypothetical protein